MLIEVVERGALVVQVEAVDATVEDLDLALFQSDATGAIGDVVEELGNCGAHEKVRAEGLAPGFYLARAETVTGSGTHAGTIALLAPSAPAPPFPHEAIEHNGSLGPGTRGFEFSGRAVGSD